MPALAQRRTFTVEDYYKMAETGILSAEDRVELIAGEIIEMSPAGSRHAACVKRLLRRLSLGLGDRAVLSVQDPVRLDEISEPEPDVAILRPRDDFYASAHPRPADVLLIIEVGESSLSYDRKVKLPLYAAHGIPEVWIVSPDEGLVEIFTANPGGIATQKRGKLLGAVGRHRRRSRPRPQRRRHPRVRCHPGCRT